MGDILTADVSARFLDLVIRTPNLTVTELQALNPVAPDNYVTANSAKRIFDA